VIPPLPIPSFEGHFVPNQQKVQRFRVWLGKQGEMALLSHLDLMRLFDRAVRRAAIPVAFTNGFHPSPRSVTSSGEIVDFELTQAMEAADFRAKLAAQLPADMPIYQVEEIAVASPSATQLLEKAEYTITLSTVPAQEDELVECPSLHEWQQWIEEIKTSDAIWQEQTTKSGKTQMVDLRDRLYELELKMTEGSQESGVRSQESEESAERSLTTNNQPLTADPTQNSKLKTQNSGVSLRYIGSCRNDGTLLRPYQIVYMFEKITNQEFQLGKVHRDQLILSHS
jgi:radical SAM-linked protein